MRLTGVSPPPPGDCHEGFCQSFCGASQTGGIAALVRGTCGVPLKESSCLFDRRHHVQQQISIPSFALAVVLLHANGSCALLQPCLNACNLGHGRLVSAVPHNLNFRSTAPLGQQTVAFIH